MQKIASALRAIDHPIIGFVGAGGKSTAIFSLAKEYQTPVFITTTTHISDEQAQAADYDHILLPGHTLSNISDLLRTGAHSITGPSIKGRRTPVTKEQLLDLYKTAQFQNIPLLIEADGSKRLPLKAPGESEPVIPPWVDEVVVVMGLSGLSTQLNEINVHRPEIFSKLSGIPFETQITLDGVGKVLSSEFGGLKNIPTTSRRIALLNQADTGILQSKALILAKHVMPVYDAIIIASLQISSMAKFPDVIVPDEGLIYAVHEKIAGIILAAGESNRFGRPKSLLDWNGKPFIWHIVKNALDANLSPVNVVIGAIIDPIKDILSGLPVNIIENVNWREGQSSSIRTGLQSLPGNSGGAIFMLIDQPQINLPLIRKLIECHQETLAPIIAPAVDGKRANPVLFDRSTFPDLLNLRGDIGGRELFSKYPVHFISWYDAFINYDVDTPEEYQRFLDYG
jgi:molybdenum cofactor cytidylyltransferase